MKICECTVGQQLTGFLAVKECVVRQASNNTNYLALRLTDGETEVTGRVWDHSGEVPTVNSVIYVSATLGEYKGQIQVTISEWRQAQSDEYNPKDFIPSHSDINSLKQQLRSHIQNVTDPGLSQLLYSLFKDNKDFVKSFLEAPAATYHHHVYLGGLLHHTVGVIDQCLRLATPGTDIDLLLTGAILHDIGKINDYDWSGCTIAMTDNGKLLGHILHGIILIKEHAKNCPELSPERLNLLLHLVASHHGKLEWGSPIEPCTVEAVLLHNADMLDVQLFKLSRAKEQLSEGENWTEKIPGINRQFFFGA